MQSFVQESVKSEKNPIEEEKDKIELPENNGGKVVIQVNLSKQNCKQDEVTQIIREIFDLSNYVVEVEKIVLPTGENTWQVRKMECSRGKESVDLPASVSVDLTEKKRKSSGTKVMKHSKLCTVKLPKSLSRSKQGSRRKLSEKLSREFESGQFDVSEVHSSSAITNLLTQLYPNPYNLISLLEVQNKSSPMGGGGAVDASESCDISFKAKDTFRKESDVEPEFVAYNASDVSNTKIHDKMTEKTHFDRMGESESAGNGCAVKKEPTIESDLFMFTGLNQTQADNVVNPECRKVKKMAISSGMTMAGTEDVNPTQEVRPGSKNRKDNQIEETDRRISDFTISVAGDEQQRSKITTESKLTKKKLLKTVNPTVEKMELDKIKRNSVKVQPTGEIVSISTVHPMSHHRTNLSFDENKEKEKLNQQQTVRKPNCHENSKMVLKPTKPKKKCVIQYLKIIKDMYEEEERCLKNKMDDAWNFAVGQVEKPGKKTTKTPKAWKNHQTMQRTIQEKEGKFKNSQSQTPKPKKVIVGNKKSITELDPKSKEPTEAKKKPAIDNMELSQPDTEFLEKKNKKTEELLRSTYNEKPEPSCSGSSSHEKSSQLRIFHNPCSNFGICTRPNTIRTDTLVFGRKIPKNEITDAEGLSIEIINRNVLETNRKIDLLIRHIDNSMDWLSQSEKTKPSNYTSLIEKAKDLSEQLDENLRQQKPGLLGLTGRNKESLRLYEYENLSYNANDLLFSPSYQSLHIFPADRSIENVRIRTGAFFSNDFTGIRNRDSFWLGSATIRPSSLGNITLPHSRSVNYLMPNDNRIIQNYIMPGGGQGRDFPRRTIESEVSELQTAPEPTVFSVENDNENEGINRRDEDEMNPCKSKESWMGFTGVCGGSDSEKGSPPSLSIGIVALDESMSAVRPVKVQEITWSFPVPVPFPVTRMHYRNERHMVFTTAEARVLHVARTTSFVDLAIMNVAQVVEQEPKQQSSVIISLHKCSSFVENNDKPEESGRMCKLVVLPSDANLGGRSTGNIHSSDEEVHRMNDTVHKNAEIGTERRWKERGRYNWDPFQWETSIEMYSGDKATISKLDSLLKRPNNLDRYDKLTWLNPFLDPYESNPADEDTETPGMMQTNFRAMRSGPHQALVQNEEDEIFPNLKNCDRRKLKLGSSTPPIFRYLSSETSITSLDEKERHTTVNVKRKSDDIRKISKFSKTNIPLFPDIKKSGDTTDLIEMEKLREEANQEDDNDSSSSSSFKSSNDFSDVSELPELTYPKKRPKSRSHFLDKLFHELRAFRKCLTRQRGLKRKSAQDESNEFEDALSDLDVEIEQENKVLVADEKQTVSETVAMNAVCTDEVGSQAMPRKIFKTSFRGKESVTELMIDLKDVSISEVSDISVEKRKLSTDHTKISIIISKQPGENGAIFCENCRKGEGGPFREDSRHSLNKADKTNCLDWKKDESLSDDDADDDYKSADSGTRTRSLENIPDKKLQDTDYRAEMLIRDSLIERQRTGTALTRHKFDFYKKMEDGTPFDTLKLDGNELLLSKYENEIAPLKKALEDMQFRVHNIQKNTFCTSYEYYERALRMAKMSAGYCQSCKSKTVIPEDPLGIYQNFIPRTSLRSPYSKHKKYYFKTTSPTNSSFYSIHSSKSDISDEYCHLNSSSSIVTNGLSKNRGPVLRESTNSNIPLFIGRTVHF